MKRLRLSDIWMRDPFLLSVRDVQDEMSVLAGSGLPMLRQLSSGSKTNKQVEEAVGKKIGGLYWLFGTTDKAPPNYGPYSEYPATGFDCYCSNDLVSWQGPFPAFRKPDHFWADTQFWAPEVYLYNNRLIMFATMKKSGKKNSRGVVILESPKCSPQGPFVALTNGPSTPPNWSCLDGTLYVERGTPYMVFCREWTEVGDGQMCCMELSADLKKSKKPTTLFTASQAPWCKTTNSPGNYITDGPFLHRCQTSNELIMLWSSIGSNGKYCVGIARSTSGNVAGPWVHDSTPLFSDDGGHAMLAPLNYQHDFGSKSPPGKHSILLLALHSPNRNVKESSPRLFGVIEERNEKTGLANFELYNFL